MDRTEYLELLDVVKAVYEDLILDALRALHTRLSANGFECSEPAYSSPREVYTWSFDAQLLELQVREEDDVTADVAIELAEEVEFDGEPEPGKTPGVAFTLKVTLGGGEVCIDWSLYNFTPQVWVPVDDGEALRERWERFVAIDISDVHQRIREHMEVYLTNRG